MKRLMAAFALGALVLAGCATGQGPGTGTSSPVSTLNLSAADASNASSASEAAKSCNGVYVPGDNPTCIGQKITPGENTPITDDTTPVPDTPQLLTPGATANIFTTDGSFDLTVGKPLAIATQSGLTNRWLGIPVKIANVDGKPNVSEGNFGISPVKYGDTGKFTTGTTIDLGQEQKTACKGVKPFSDIALTSSDSGVGYDIGPGTKGTFCVVFLYDAVDHPTTISYFSAGQLDKSTVPDATWRLGAKPKPAAPSPTGITYKVTSDGGINSVTYSTAGFSQQQDTSVAGNSWSKTIPNEGVSVAVLVAQNARGGVISCSITVDGEQVAHQSSHGSYAVVSCTADN